MLRIVTLIFDAWKKQNVVTFKDDEAKVHTRAFEVIEDNFWDELELEDDVNKMLDDLEREHGGTFQRGKMYHLLKQKIAKDRKFIL